MDRAFEVLATLQKSKETHIALERERVLLPSYIRLAQWNFWRNNRSLEDIRNDRGKSAKNGNILQFRRNWILPLTSCSVTVNFWNSCVFSVEGNVSTPIHVGRVITPLITSLFACERGRNTKGTEWKSEKNLWRTLENFRSQKLFLSGKYWSTDREKLDSVLVMENIMLRFRIIIIFCSFNYYSKGVYGKRAWCSLYYQYSIRKILLFLFILHFANKWPL